MADRRRGRLRRRVWWVAAALALLFVAAWYFSDHAARWISPSPESIYIAPKPTRELRTGSDSAQFSFYAPQYPGSEIVNAATYRNPDGELTMVELTTPDDLPTVSEYYRRELAKLGFRPKLNKAGEGLSIRGARLSAGLSVLIRLQPRVEGGTTIELTDTSDGFSSTTIEVAD